MTKILILNSHIDPNSYYSQINKIFPNTPCTPQNLQITYADLPGVFPLKNTGSHADQNGTITAFWSPDVMKQVRNMVKPNQYDGVIFCFNAAPYEPQIGETGGITDTEQVYLGMQLMTVRLDGNELVYAIHEIMHMYTHQLAFQGIDVVDNMDMTHVGTQLIPYYMNNQPYNPESNYARTWADIAPYQSKLDTVTPLVKSGQTSRYVGQVQTQLVNLGYNLPLTGFFGAMTKAAVQDVQIKNNLVADGVVGPKTAYYLVKH